VSEKRWFQISGNTIKKLRGPRVSRGRVKRIRKYVYSRIKGRGEGFKKKARELRGR